MDHNKFCTNRAANCYAFLFLYLLWFFECSLQDYQGILFIENNRFDVGVLMNR